MFLGANLSEDSHTITVLLEEWRSGKSEAGRQLMELVYDELHQIASRKMQQESKEHILQTTALVHELYLRLCGSQPIDLRDRGHFFAVAAQQLRRILIDHARRAGSEKRGGGYVRLPLLEFDGETLQCDERLLALDEALTSLQAFDERSAKVIELRFFGGLSEAEAARALDISIATLKRDWDFARTWLAARLK